MAHDTVDQPLKILRVIARLNIGGPSRHVVVLGDELRARGHDTLLIHGSVGPDEASFEHLASERGLRLLKLPGLGRRLSLFDDARAFWAILRTMFRESPDVIHSHTAKAGALARASALVYNACRPRRRRALVVHTFHGHVLDGYFGPVGNAAVRFTERALARITDYIVTISPGQQRDLAERFRIASRAQIVVIPLGLELAPLAALSERKHTTAGESRGERVIGYVGRFAAIKDLGTLAHAFVQVAARIPRVRLLLVGDGPARAEVERILTAAGVQAQVSFAGWREDLAALYRDMDVCVLSSLNEGTPVAIIEAMAAAKPVVATRVGGVPDVVDDGRTGVLVPPSRPDLLAEAIVGVLAREEESQRMALAAREDVVRRFSPARLADEMCALYARGLKERRGTIPRTS